MKAEPTKAQIAALKWAEHSGSNQPCYGPACGHPHATTIHALGRKGLLSVSGGYGWTITVGITPLGRQALAEARERENGNG